MKPSTQKRLEKRWRKIARKCGVNIDDEEIQQRLRAFDQIINESIQVHRERP